MQVLIFVVFFVMSNIITVSIESIISKQEFFKSFMEMSSKYILLRNVLECMQSISRICNFSSVFGVLMY